MVKSFESFLFDVRNIYFETFTVGSLITAGATAQDATR